MDRAKRITERQRRFLEEYPVDFNATAAAVRAGYGARRANSVASRLIARFARDPVIAALKRAEAEAFGLDGRAIHDGLMTEALGQGPDTRTGARLRAWDALAAGYLAALERSGEAAEADEVKAIQFLAPGQAEPRHPPRLETVPGWERPAGLSEREARFVREYGIDCCAKHAAIRAGYSRLYADARAHKLLERLRDRPEIAEAERVRRDALCAGMARAFAGFLAEARGLGADTNSNTRVTAWKRLSRYLGEVARASVEQGGGPSMRIEFFDCDGNWIDTEKWGGEKAERRQIGVRGEVG